MNGAGLALRSSAGLAIGHIGPLSDEKRRDDNTRTSGGRFVVALRLRAWGMGAPDPLVRESAVLAARIAACLGAGRAGDDGRALLAYT